MIDIILISHGFFAKEALASAEMIVGKQADCYSISVTVDKEVEKVEQELAEIYESLNHDHEVLILCDIFGGTPSNVAVRFLMTHPNIQIISGFNLPMLLDTFLSRESSLKEVTEKINTMYRDTIVDVNELLEQQIESVSTVEAGNFEL